MQYKPKISSYMLLQNFQSMQNILYWLKKISKACKISDNVSYKRFSNTYEFILIKKMEPSKTN